MNSKLKNPSTGSILFEVVLALALFVFAAAVISGGFSASLKNVDRIRQELDASNLAITTLGEIELGLKPMVTTAPADFESPFEKWTWQVVVTEPSEDLDMGGNLALVEVIIENKEKKNQARIARMMRGFVPASSEP